MYILNKAIHVLCVEGVDIIVLNFMYYCNVDDVLPDLSHCLVFFTGSDRIPPTGFHDSCTLNFNPSNLYPTSSTCALVLTLPTIHYESYDDFRKNMVYALLNHGGFGLC